MWPLLLVRTIFIAGCLSVVASDQTGFSESKIAEEKVFYKTDREDMSHSTAFRSLSLNENNKSYFYKRSNEKENSVTDDLVDPAKMAYGEKDEKWKVLGYSKETGYPIIDLSALGIDTSPKPYVPVESQSKPKDSSMKIEKPMTYSEMKGEGLNKNLLSTAIQSENKQKTPPIKEPKMNDKGKKVAHKLFMQLHRTNRYETVRSILSPDLNPAKYRITHDRDKFISLFRSGSRGKYDIRYLDVEKLKDIVIPEANVLVYKYFRDIPSLPLIYECKIKIAHLMWAILGGFKRLDVLFGYGEAYNMIGKQEQWGLKPWAKSILRSLARFMLSMKKAPPVTARDPAFLLESQINTLASELSFWTDKECQGEMDDMDRNQFNFEYKYMLETIQLGAIKEAEKWKRLKDLKNRFMHED